METLRAMGESERRKLNACAKKLFVLSTKIYFFLK